MAKAKVTTLKNWEEVDASLRRMGEIDISLKKLEGDMTLKVNTIKEEFDRKSEGLHAERKALDADITSFAESCKDEFVKTRSKVLTFGVVAWRVTQKLVIKSKAACVAALKALGLNDYLRIIEEPDKEALTGLDALQLAKIGAHIKTEDKIRIEPNLEKLADKVMAA